MRCGLIVGGAGFGPQIDALTQQVEVIIATPGRLLDHMQRGGFSFNQVEFLVLDECDRMLDMGFLPDVRRILSRFPRQRQTLLFSATLPYDIQRLTQDFQKDPITLRISQDTIPAGIKHVQYRVPQWHKADLLLDLLNDPELRSVLVFLRTKRRAEELHRMLTTRGISATLIHGDRSMKERLAALAEFRSKETRVMIATDIASRGLDIHDISHVVNYDVPLVAEEYIHRVGRTGRMLATGIAYMFSALDENQFMRNIEKLLGAAIPTLVHPEFSYPGDRSDEEIAALPPPPPQRGRGLSGRRPSSRR